MPLTEVWFGGLAHTAKFDTNEAQQLLNSLGTEDKIGFVSATEATTLTQPTDDREENTDTRQHTPGYNMKHGTGTSDNRQSPSKETS